MNWFLLGLCLIIYPAFGIAIYIVRNRLYKIRNFSYIILSPIGISFFLGMIILAYAIAIN